MQYVNALGKINTRTYIRRMSATQSRQTRLIENLTRLMELEQLTHNALAEQTGISQPTITRILSGESKDPRHTNVQRLAARFGVSVAELRGEVPLPDTDVMAVRDNIAIYSEVKQASSLAQPLIKKIQELDQNGTLDKDLVSSLTSLLDSMSKRVKKGDSKRRVAVANAELRTYKESTPKSTPEGVFKVRPTKS